MTICSTAFVALAGSLLFLAACDENAVTNDNSERIDPVAVAERLRAFEAARVRDWASRDPERIASHYARGASVILPCQPRVTGAAGIRARIANLLRDRRLDLRFDPDRVDVAASGDLAYSVGTYMIRGIHPATGRRGLEYGNYLATYRRQPDGTWKIVDEVAVPGGPPYA